MIPFIEYQDLTIGKCKELDNMDFCMSELKDRVISKCEWMVLRT